MHTCEMGRRFRRRLDGRHYPSVNERCHELEGAGMMSAHTMIMSPSATKDGEYSAALKSVADPFLGWLKHLHGRAPTRDGGAAAPVEDVAAPAPIDSERRVSPEAL